MITHASRQAPTRWLGFIIVGGGPVGLALAVALDRFGIRSLVVERSATTTDHPKSRGCCMDNHLHSVGQSLGFIYDAGAVIPDGSTRPAYNPRFYTPIDRPGSRFPHRWMDAARTETTLDWFDQAFVLVTGTEGNAWLEAGADVARRLRVPLELKRWPASHEAALAIGCGKDPFDTKDMRSTAGGMRHDARCPSGSTMVKCRRR